MIEKILEDRDKCLRETHLTLSADKTELFLFVNHDYSDPQYSFRGEGTKTAHTCRHLGVNIGSNLAIEIT